MINNIVFVRELNSILKYHPNNDDNSFYKTYKMFNGEKNRQIRFSSHGTFLKTWIDKEYDPAFGINISIAFTENGTPTNFCHIDFKTNEPYKDCRPCLSNQELIGNPCKPRKVPNYNQKKRPFSVTQYVYNCQNFDGSEIEMFVNAIKKASINGEYVDPFKGVEGKEAIPVTLEPIEENKKYNQQNINCNRIMNKNRIRLTESQLHRLLKESVNKVLKEGVIELDNMSNYELTQNVRFAFTSALKNASKDVEKECQELLNDKYYMYGVGDTEDEQHMMGTTYRDWLYDYLHDIVMRHIDNIY